MDAERFAKSWIDAWHRKDLEAVLALFADDVRFVSPTAARVTGHPVVEGKAALRAYWQAALARIDRLRFTLDYVLWDPAARVLSLIYDDERDGRRCRRAEVLRFRGDLIVAGEAFHGVEL
jgi:ketosteroid isomerase-like protein